MAALWKIANYDNNDSYDFTNTNSVVRLIHRSIHDQTTENGEPVEITWQTAAKGTATQIREAFRDIERLLKQAIEWQNDPTSKYSIWLHAKSDGESERRSVILSWHRKDSNQELSDPLLEDTQLIISDWTITRGPYWEALISAMQQYEWVGSQQLGTGGCYSGTTLPATPSGYAVLDGSTKMNKGTAPGRIRRAKLIASSTTGSNARKKYWVGLKTTKTALTSNQWKPHADLDVSLSTDCPVEQTDSDALNSKSAQCTFATTTDFANRCAAMVPVYSESEDAKAGTYLVLARMRLTATGSCRTAAFVTPDMLTTSITSFYDSIVADTMQDVYVESTKYHFYEMGIVQLPPEGFRAAQRSGDFNGVHMAGTYIGIAAERLSGTPSLYIDYYTLIPMQHHISAANANIETNLHCEIFTDELDNHIGITGKYSTYWTRRIHELSTNNWVWPVAPNDTGILIVATDIEINDSDSEHNPTTDAAQFEVDVVPRYYTYNAD